MLKKTFQLGSRVYRRLYNDLVSSPLGHGSPKSCSQWRTEYQGGRWDFLDDLEERARFMIVVGYSIHVTRSPAILDVGCGPGTLAELFAPFSLASYLGLDLCDEAIRKARSRAVGNARFEVGDFETWQTSEKYDVIVFCESLYYARKPADVVLRLSRFLTDNGYIIISMYRRRKHGILWKKISKGFTVTSPTMVENEAGERWDIRVFRPEAPARPE